MWAHLLKDKAMDIYKQIDQVQQWLRENQAKGSDAQYMAKVAEMRKLMNEAYTIN